MPSTLPHRPKPPKKPTGQPSCKARSNEVPEHLVGKFYRDFTLAEWWETKKYRRSRNSCTSCGVDRLSFGRVKVHHFTECPLRARFNKFRSENNLCLECGKSGHAWEECPIHVRLEKELAPFATRFDAPKEYKGWSYATMTESHMKEVRTWRAQQNNICTECASHMHLQYTCPIRLKRVQKRYEERVKDLAARKRKPGFKVIRPLSKLPTELRMEILILVTQDWGDVLVEPGYLSRVKRLVKAGFDMDEAVHAFVQTTTFHVRTSSDGSVSNLDRFGKFLESHRAFDQLRSVHLTNLKHGLPGLLKQCYGLKKLCISVDADVVCRWSEPMSDGGENSEPKDKVSEFVERLDLQMM